MIQFAVLALSLAFLGMSSAPRQNPAAQENKVDYSKGGHEAIFVPDDVTLLQEDTLPLDAAPNEINTNRMTRDNPRGMRLFTLILKPGQSIKITLKATPMTQYFMNWALPPDRSDLLYSKVKRASEAQLTQNRPSLSFQNTTPLPYQISFFFSGLADNRYSVKLERK